MTLSKSLDYAFNLFRSRLDEGIEVQRLVSEPQCVENTERALEAIRRAARRERANEARQASEVVP